jgi:hypothetical protein
MGRNPAMLQIKTLPREVLNRSRAKAGIKIIAAAPVAGVETAGAAVEELHSGR